MKFDDNRAHAGSGAGRMAETVMHIVVFKIKKRPLETCRAAVQQPKKGMCERRA
jgi:hypothetical protein